MPDIVVTIETTPPPTLNVFPALLPTQFGNAGKLLATNGSSASWTNDPTLNSLRITNGSYPFLHLKNTGAPVDKKNVRGYVELGGKVEISRLNDAETVGTNLIAWDVNNNCGIGTGVPQAKQHVVAPALSSVAGSVVDIARWELTNTNVSALRLYEIRNSTGGDWTTATTRLQKWMDVTPQGFIEFNPVGLTHGLALGTHYAGFPIAAINLVPAGATNTVGIGTQNAPSKLTVEGDIRLLTNGNALLFTDTGGSTPYMVSAVDGNFYFTGTTSTGAQQSVFRCAMRADNSPLQIDRPLKIGAAGAQIASVLYATLASYAPASIAASGGVQSLDITVTGATSPAVVTVGHAPLSNASVIVRGAFVSANTIRLSWINPTAASVTLTAANYFVQVTNF